jgi:hypothetical protein
LLKGTQSAANSLSFSAMRSIELLTLGEKTRETAAEGPLEVVEKWSYPQKQKVARSLLLVQSLTAEPASQYSWTAPVQPWFDGDIEYTF